MKMDNKPFVTKRNEYCVSLSENFIYVAVWVVEIQIINFLNTQK